MQRLPWIIRVVPCVILGPEKGMGKAEGQIRTGRRMVTEVERERWEDAGRGCEPMHRSLQILDQGAPGKEHGCAYLGLRPLGSRTVGAQLVWF